MNVGWTVSVVRWHHEPETRWWYRRILRRRTRYVEEIIYRAPATGMRLDRRLNGPTNMSVAVPSGVLTVDDPLAELRSRPHC